MGVSDGGVGLDVKGFGTERARLGTLRSELKPPKTALIEDKRVLGTERARLVTFKALAQNVQD